MKKVFKNAVIKPEQVATMGQAYQVTLTGAEIIVLVHVITNADEATLGDLTREGMILLARAADTITVPLALAVGQPILAIEATLRKKFDPSNRSDTKVRTTAR